MFVIQQNKKFEKKMLQFRSQIIIIFLISILNVINAQSLANSLIILPKPFEANRVKAALGEDFILTCLIQDEKESPSALKWYTPNGVEVGLISPTTDAKRIYTKLRQNQLILHLHSIVPQDAGVFVCRGVQDGAPQEAKVELVLEKKISFENTLPEQFIRQGEDSLIQCRASSIPGPEITWFRKGINIEIKNDQKYIITNDGLTVKNVQVEDEGAYYCQASVTSTGEVKRAEIQVQVMVAPRWVQQPEDQEGVEGQDIVIKCEVFAKPRPAYRWYRGDVLLAGDKYTISGNAIRFRVERYDSGTYTCMAENNYGKIHANFRLNALVSPHIAPMEDVHVIEGNQAKLRCFVQNAYPKATIRWKFTDTQEFIQTNDTNFKIVDDSDRQYNQNDYLINSESELIINRASRLYKRNFTCVATNKAAFSERQVQLLVEYKPTQLVNQEARMIYYSWLYVDHSGMSGSVQSSMASRAYPVTFTCMADGEPRPRIQWFFKSNEIKHDNIKYRLIKDEDGYSQIEINPRDLNDFGDYQCLATNRHGNEHRIIQLRQATAPKFAPLLYLKSSNPESIFFDVKPSDASEADGGMPIEAYKIQWRFLNGEWSSMQEKTVEVDLAKFNIYTAEVQGLNPDTEYLFRVAAVNRPGIGVWSPKEFKVRTMPRRQPDPVRLTSKEECQAATRCYIEWVVDSNGGSIIREFSIRYRRVSFGLFLNRYYQF